VRQELQFIPTATLNKKVISGESKNIEQKKMLLVVCQFITFLLLITE